LLQIRPFSYILSGDSADNNMRLSFINFASAPE
jgi:hypothetical protein